MSLGTNVKCHWIPGRIYILLDKVYQIQIRLTLISHVCCKYKDNYQDTRAGTCELLNYCPSRDKTSISKCFMIRQTEMLPNKSN